MINDNDINEILVKPDNKMKEQIRMLKLNKCDFFDFNSETGLLQKVGKPIIEPIFVFWSLSNEICIACYTTFAVIFRVPKF